jgi:RHS repeat-associated protein
MVGRTRTSDSQVTTYTYDFRNRLTEVLIKTSTGTTVQDDKFTYDLENRRIGKNTLSGGQSWTGYDRVNPYADFNTSGSLTYRYLYGNAIDFLLARADTSGTPMWYLTDKLGSVREDVQTSGSVLDSITYDSYGNIKTESSPSSGDRFKFTGREWDSEIGQYFYRARYYGPAIGRFESEDPIGFSAGDTNLYRYVFNRPSEATDPSGEVWPFVIVAIIAGGVVLLTPSTPPGTGGLLRLYFNLCPSPTIPHIESDPTVLAAFDAAWTASNPYSPPVPRGQGGSAKVEQGGWIIWNNKTCKYRIITRPPVPDREHIDLMPRPVTKAPEIVVATYHTHPNTPAEGYPSAGASGRDKIFTDTISLVPAIMITHEGLKVYAPHTSDWEGGNQ